MYQRSYGETHFPDGFDAGLGFAHTSDNLGPQSVPQVAEAHRDIARAHPDALIRPGTLEDYAAVVWPRRAELPVVELELGDSWIHGTASDPVKLARFRALQRLYDDFAAEGLDPPRRAFGRGLTLVAEHTWGVDIKSYLRDTTAWDRPALETARATDARFAYTEASWSEQRAYLDAAVAALAPADRDRAARALAATEPPPPPPATGTATALRLDGWLIEVAPDTGDVRAVTTPAGARLPVRIGYRHESYDAADMARHMQTYLTHREEWAILDHDKPGLAGAATARSAAFAPAFRGTTADTIVAAMPPEAADALGAPPRVELALAPAEGGLLLTLRLRDKPANRMPEAGFLSVCPEGATDWRFLRTGLWLPAARVAPRGGGHLQAVFAAAATLPGGATFEIVPLDTALVAPEGGDFMAFTPDPPDFGQGIRFNLYNNKWGTNFPMWWEGTLTARFLLKA